MSQNKDFGPFSLSQDEWNEFGCLFGVLAAYMNRFSMPEMSEERAKKLTAKYEAQGVKIDIVSIRRKAYKKYLMSRLASDKQALEVKVSELETLLGGIRSDISKTQVQIAQIDALISYLTE
jgi:hypothetical protein